MNHSTTEAYADYAVITMDRRGNITQLSAPNIKAAMQLARENVDLGNSVTVENKEGRVVYDRVFAHRPL